VPCLLVSMASLLINFTRANRTYAPEEKISGLVEVSGGSDAFMGEFIVTLRGTVSCTAKSCGTPPSNFYEQILTVKAPGGQNSVSCQFEPTENALYSYEGTHIHVTYFVFVEAKMKSRKTLLQQKTVFVCSTQLLQCPSKSNSRAGPVQFSLEKNGLRTRDSVVLGEYSSFLSLLGDFRLNGSIEACKLEVGTPFTGSFQVESCDLPIRSIELELCQLEKWQSTKGGVAQDVNAVFSCQVADGDVCRGVHIPMFMIFPPVSCCPNFRTEEGLQVDFEIQLLVFFVGEYPVITEKFPITFDL
jgi:hypothetical protein